LEIKVLKKVLFSIFFILIVTSLIYPYPGGITGRTRKSGTQGCGSCHTSGTGVTGSFTSPDTILAGATVSITLNMSGTSSGRMGVDIAVQRGTLAVGSAGTYLQLSNMELIHKSPGISGTSIALTFSYTAPTTAGFDTIYATCDKGYSGNWAFAPNKKVVIRTTSGIENNNIPVSLKLWQNYPNPFNPNTSISFDIPVNDNVTIKIFDVLGNEVHTVFSGKLNAGNHHVVWNAENFSSGVYYYTLYTSQGIITRKMMLTK
jgi:hypothetical protein